MGKILSVYYQFTVKSSVKKTWVRYYLQFENIQLVNALKSFNFVSKSAFSEASFFCFQQHLFLISENEKSNIRFMVSRKLTSFLFRFTNANMNFP